MRDGKPEAIRTHSSLWWVAIGALGLENPNALSSADRHSVHWIYEEKVETHLVLGPFAEADEAIGGVIVSTGDAEPIARVDPYGWFHRYRYLVVKTPGIDAPQFGATAIRTYHLGEEARCELMHMGAA